VEGYRAAEPGPVQLEEEEPTGATGAVTR